MAEPVVYVSTWKIKEGKFEEYRRFHDELVKIVDQNEPRVAAFLAFANDDGTEITNVHVFPDAASLDRHMRVLAEEAGLLANDLTAVFRFMDPGRIQVFGTPSDSAMEMDRPLIEAGVPYTSKRRFIGGFTRPPLG